MMISVFRLSGQHLRSPMAEAVFVRWCERPGWRRIRVDPPESAAGTRANLLTGNAENFGQYGISHEGIRARQISREDLDRFDIIVAMDNSNMSALRRMAKTSAELYLLTDYIPDADRSNVPDPYYTGNFEEVYELVEAGCRALLQKSGSGRGSDCLGERIGSRQP